MVCPKSTLKNGNLLECHGLEPHSCCASKSAPDFRTQYAPNSDLSSLHASPASALKQRSFVPSFLERNRQGAAEPSSYCQLLLYHTEGDQKNQITSCPEHLSFEHSIVNASVHPASADDLQTVERQSNYSRSMMQGSFLCREAHGCQGGRDA